MMQYQEDEGDPPKAGELEKEADAAKAEASSTVEAFKMMLKFAWTVKNHCYRDISFTFEVILSNVFPYLEIISTHFD